MKLELFLKKRLADNQNRLDFVRRELEQCCEGRLTEEKRDGSVLAKGKENPEWNFSAPHGASRIMSRTAAKENLSLDEYKKTMEGIYTTSVSEETLDEAPMAYKALSDIIGVIEESVDVILIYR